MIPTLTKRQREVLEALRLSGTPLNVEELRSDARTILGLFMRLLVSLDAPVSQIGTARWVITDAGRKALEDK